MSWHLAGRKVKSVFRRNLSLSEAIFSLHNVIDADMHLKQLRGAKNGLRDDFEIWGIAHLVAEAVWACREAGRIANSQPSAAATCENVFQTCETAVNGGDINNYA